MAGVGHPCFVPDLRGKAFRFSLLSMMLAVCGLVICGLYYVELHFLYTLFVERFYHERMVIFLNLLK